MTWGSGLTLLACLVAGTAYSGAVTGFALVAYVLPSMLVVGLLTSSRVPHCGATSSSWPVPHCPLPRSSTW